MPALMSVPHSPGCHSFYLLFFGHTACRVLVPQQGFPGSSNDKEFTCHAGNLGLFWSLGWEDPLEEVLATHSSILAWRIPMDRGAWRATVQRATKSQTWLSVHKPHHTSHTHETMHDQGPTKGNWATTYWKAGPNQQKNGLMMQLWLFATYI